MLNKVIHCFINNFVIYSCDYRGFGDSTKVRRITESGVVTDALTVYKWVRQELCGDKEIPVFVWGHSLGAGYVKICIQYVYLNKF